MKLILFICIILIQSSLVSQELPNKLPDAISSLDILFDPNGAEQLFSKPAQLVCDSMLQRRKDEGRSELPFSLEETRILSYTAMKEHPWDALEMGCSWYCAGGPDSLFASSFLAPEGQSNYSVTNIHDLNFNTAWVEGVEGSGIGERITYSFRATSPRITSIIIVNGYTKSRKTWQENGRVKRLQVSFNGIPIAVLCLQDNHHEQHFNFEPIGLLQTQEWQTLESASNWTLTFEIVEVYSGTKYDDTAITEIYFDGVDVH